MRGDELNDQHLLECLRNGDAAAFRTLYEKAAPRLQGFAARFRLSREEADEIVQETFIRIWRHREKIDPSASFSTYLITIAKHLIYNSIKKAGYREAYINEVSVLLKQTSGQTALNERELQQEIGKAIMELPEKCRQVFRKSRLEGYSNQQIAEELNISKSTVENQLNKALRMIRQYLEVRGYNTSVIIMFLMELIN